MLVTWNDYTENSQVSPALGMQYGFYDLTTYYVNWYKHTDPPPVSRDALYVFYRNQVAQAKPSDPMLKGPMTIAESRTGPSDQLEVLVFTTAGDYNAGILPTVTVTTGSASETFTVRSAGMSVFSVPIMTGKISVRLAVKGKNVLTMSPPELVRSQVFVQDMTYHAASASEAATVNDCGYH